MGKGPWERGQGTGLSQSPWGIHGPWNKLRVHVFCCTSTPLGFGGFLSSLQALGVHRSRILLWAVSGLGIKAALCLFPEGAGLSCRELSLLRNWWLLLHGGVEIEQLKGQAAKLAYFCVLSHRV